MKFGSLFAGIGGIDLGLERAGMECIWQVENDDYCNRVLEKHWPDVQRFGDVRECTDLPPVDLIAGGFPCQPHSVAGKRRGAEDDRNLWPEFIRVIRELRPRYVLAENVPGIITTYIDTVLSDLESEGYTCATLNLPAVAFDAPHRRERIFIVAYSEANTFSTNTDSLRCDRTQVNQYRRPKQRGAKLRDKQERQLRSLGGDVAQSKRTTGGRGSTIRQGDGQKRQPTEAERESLQPRDGQAYTSLSQSGSEDVADTEGTVCTRKRSEQNRKSRRFTNSGEVMADATGRSEQSSRSQRNVGRFQDSLCGESRYQSYWTTEPDVGRVAHGVSSRVDRLRGLGNAVIPQVAEWIGRRILEFDS